MAKPSKSLAIWLNGHYVGIWGRSRGVETFQYDQNWLNNKYARALSLSLPFTPGNQPFSGDVVKFYFDNLLPDSRDIRERLATKFSASSASPFDLLAEIGRDCVGAIQILPIGESPKKLKSILCKTVDEAQIAEILRNTVRSNTLGLNHGKNELRLSIAGAQEKTALLWHHNRWCNPIGSTPTTHILKLPLGLIGNMKLDMNHSVENEWLCSKIIHEYGLPIANCEMTQFEDINVLVVKRFDRKFSADNKWIIRLPQEDFCQAKGISPLQKYQNDGGLGITESMRLLDGSIQSKIDKKLFFKTQIIFWILCATDGHGKNFSIFHLPNNNFKMTPLYDVLSAFPVIGNGKNKLSIYDAKLAMSIDGKNKHYRIREIQKRHFINHAVNLGLSNKFTDEMIVDIATNTDKVIQKVLSILPASFPKGVSDPIFKGMNKQAKKLLD